MTMTPEQIELARHALGLTNGRRQSCRNLFATGPGHSDELTGGDDLFRLTVAGARAALQPGERLCPEDFPNQEAAQHVR